MPEREGSNPDFDEATDQEPRYGDGGESPAAPDEEGGTGIDTGTRNEDLHGQAREVAESANEPGGAQTPAG